MSCLCLLYRFLKELTGDAGYAGVLPCSNTIVQHQNALLITFL